MTLPPDTDNVPDAPPPPRTNRFAIVALITGILGLVLFAIGFAVAALVQTGRRGEKGRALAVTALTVSAAWLIAGTVLLVDTGRDEHALAREADGPRASVLAVGDCFAGFRQEGAKVFAQAAPCTIAHEGEVLAKPDLPISGYPGDERLAAEGEKACRVQASSLYAARRGDEFVLSIDRPDKRAWDRGEHAVTCLLRYSDGQKNVRLEELPKSLSQLVAGDCVGTWSESGFVRLVDCAKRHEVQVFARITPKGEKYPDEAKSYVLCADQARRVFGPNPPAHLLMRYAGPDALEWARGERYIACLVLKEKGSLTHSVIPK